MVILVANQKRYWNPSDPITVDDSITTDGQTLTIKTTVFRCVKIKVGSNLQCSWLDEEEGFFNPCTVTEIHDDSITVTYDDGETSKTDLEYIRFPDKTIDEHTVDIETNLGSVFPEADAIFQKQAEAKEAEEEKVQNAKKKALEAEEKKEQERKKTLMKTNAAAQESSQISEPQEASKIAAPTWAEKLAAEGTKAAAKGYFDINKMALGLDKKTTENLANIKNLQPPSDPKEFKKEFLRLTSLLDFQIFGTGIEGMGKPKINDAVFLKMEHFIKYWKLEMSSLPEYSPILSFLEEEYKNAQQKKKKSLITLYVPIVIMLLILVGMGLVLPNM
jgi:hypothetical protein